MENNTLYHLDIPSSLDLFEPVLQLLSRSHNKEAELELSVKAHLNTYVSVLFNHTQLASSLLTRNREMC